MASITLRVWLRQFEGVIYTSKRNNEIPEFKMHSCSADTNNPDARALNVFKFKKTTHIRISKSKMLTKKSN